MGDPFLRAYYSIYDLDNKRIGLVGIAETTKLESLRENLPLKGNVEKFLEDIGITQNNTFILEIFISCISLICCLCCCCCV